MKTELVELDTTALAGIVGGNLTPYNPPPGIRYDVDRFLRGPAPIRPTPNPGGQYWENSPSDSGGGAGSRRPPGGPPRNMSVPRIAR